MFLCIFRLQQVEEIVASLIPGKNLLTKTIKKMFDNLLCWDKDFSDISSRSGFVQYRCKIKKENVIHFTIK